MAMDIPDDQESLATSSPIATAQSSFNEPSFLEDRVLRTPGADQMYKEISDGNRFSSPRNSSSPSFTEITQAFSDNSSTPVKDMDDNLSIGSYSNLSSMKQMFGSESSFFSQNQQDGSLARKAMAYCNRLLRQSECSKWISCDRFWE